MRIIYCRILLFWLIACTPILLYGQLNWKEFYSLKDQSKQIKVNSAIVMKCGRIACVGKSGENAALFIFDPITGRQSLNPFVTQYNNSSFFSVTETSMGELILVGKSGKEARPLVVRYDISTGKDFSVDAIQCRPKTLQKVAQLANSRVLAASLESDSLYFYEIRDKVVPLFSISANECESLVGMVSDPLTGGIWLFGNTRKFERTRKNDSWLLHLNNQGNPGDVFEHLGTEIYEEALDGSVSMDGTLSICGKTKSSEDYLATWFALAKSNKRDSLVYKNSWEATEFKDADCYGACICKTFDGQTSILVHRKGSNWRIIELGSPPAPTDKYSETNIPEKFTPACLLESPHGDLIFIGNESDGLKVYQLSKQLIRRKSVPEKLILGTHNIATKRDNKTTILFISIPLINKGSEDAGPIDINISVTGEAIKPGLKIIWDTIYCFPIKKNDTLVVPVYLTALDNLPSNSSFKINLAINTDGRLNVEKTYEFKCDSIFEISKTLISVNRATDSETQKSKESIIVSVITTSKKKAIDKLEIFVNHNVRPLSRNQIKVTSISNGFAYEFNTDLDEGPNTITAVYNHVDTQKITIRLKPKIRKLFAFAVGVNGDGLSMSINSAKQFLQLKRVWESSSFFSQITIYDNFVEHPEEATTENIKSMLVQIRDDMLKDSRENGPADYYFYFFFCGHGQTSADELYLVTSDYAENKKVLSLSLSNIFLALNDNMPGSKFLFLDVCRKSSEEFKWKKEKVDSFPFPNATAVFFSCMPGMVSFEPDTSDSQITIFTEALLNSFKMYDQSSKNCSITVQDLSESIQKKVFDLLRIRRKNASNKVQLPVLGVNSEFEKTKPEVIKIVKKK